MNELARLEEWQSLKRQIRYTMLVRAMVKTVSACVLERGQIQSRLRDREAFLNAFNKLVTRSIEYSASCDAFSTEVVSKLLLSTGITPDASVVSNWMQSMSRLQDQSASSLSGRKKGLWEDILAGRPIGERDWTPED